MSFDDRTAELWLEIDQLHLKYLQHEENPSKLELRKKLERKAKDYLCMVPQDRKFVFQTTWDIIANSARWIADFSLVKASQGFSFIEQYAANIINQPWRQEFRKIKQYNGYYTHNVKSCLSGAEKMFFDMGYIRDSSDPEVLTLDLGRNGDISQKMDSVTQVARDCLLACVECNILQEIFNGVLMQFSITMEELLDFRRDYVGSSDDAIREIVYRKNQLRCQQYPGGAYNPHRVSQVFSNPYANPGYPPHSFTPVQHIGVSGYQTMGPYMSGAGPQYTSAPGLGAPPGLAPPPPGLAPQAAPVPLSITNMNMNGLQPHQAQLPNNHPPGQPTTIGAEQMNGFYPTIITTSHDQMMAMQGNYPMQGQMPQGVAVGQLASIPTGRLVDLEQQHHSSPGGSTTSTLRNQQIPITILELTGDDRNQAVNDVGARNRDSSRDPAARRSYATAAHNGNGYQQLQQQQQSRDHNNIRRENTNGSRHEAHRRSGSERKTSGNRNSGIAKNGEQQIESWDFVYNQLEQIGYNKDQAERPDVLAGGARRDQQYRLERGDSAENEIDDEEEEGMRRRLDRMHIRDYDNSRNREKTRDRSGRPGPSQRVEESGLTSGDSEQDNSRYSSANSFTDARPVERPQRTHRGGGGQQQPSGRSGQQSAYHGAAGQSQQSDTAGKWECSTCTYHNVAGTNICEICSKTRVEGKDNRVGNARSSGDNASANIRKENYAPDASEEPVCPRCTFLNQPGAKVCEVCGSTMGAPPIPVSRKRM